MRYIEIVRLPVRYVLADAKPEKPLRDKHAMAR